MSATYINTGGELIQYTDIITAAEMNTLGTTPYNFITPQNFIPLCFGITPISGNTPQVFTSILQIQTLINRIFFQGDLPTGLNFYSFWGYRLVPSVSPTFSMAFNIDTVPNNFLLTPVNGIDPTPGDYDYKYNLIGCFLI